MFLFWSSSLNKERNITNKSVVSIWFIHFSIYVYHSVRFTRIYDFSILIYQWAPQVYKLDEQTFSSEFESHWVPHSYDLWPRRSRTLSKLLHTDLSPCSECVYISSSSSCHDACTNIPDPLSPLLPIIHRFWQVFRAISRIVTELLYVCSSWSSSFCLAICGGP